MKLNKFLLSSAFAVMAFSTVVNAAPTITFEGEVTDQTCTPSINGQDNAIVLLPTVPSSELATVGDVTGLTPFTISVAKCTADATNALNITTKFLGRNVKNGNLVNTALTPTAATNVALQLTTDEKGETPVVLDGVTPVAGLVVEKGQTSGEHTFGVRYIAVDGAATAGKVTSIAEYTLSYL